MIVAENSVYEGTYTLAGAVEYHGPANETVIPVQEDLQQMMGALGHIGGPAKTLEDFQDWWSESEANNGVLVQELAEHFD